MSDVTLVCWAPECANVLKPTSGHRPRLYCSPACKQRAFRRAGHKAPTEPYPPLGPAPLQQDAPAVTVAVQSEQAAVQSGPPGGRSSDAAGKARKAHRDSVQPSAVATAGKAPAPAASGPPRGTTESPESVGSGGAAEDPPAAASVTQLHLAITEDSTIPVTITVHPMVARYQADLEDMGQADTRQGLQVMAMAEKLVSSATSASAAGTLSKELDRLMAALEEASPAAQVSADPSVAIRERTLAKLRAVAG